MSVTIKSRNSEATFTHGTWASTDRELQQALQASTDARGYEALPSDPEGLEHAAEVAEDYGGEVLDVEAEPGGVPGRIY